MIHVVLDTNILVSAGISAGGDCDRIIQAVLQGKARLVVCPSIVEEYLEVLHRSKFTRYAFPPWWLQRLILDAEHLAFDPKDLPDLPDPEDRVFLAVARRAELLVTGNLKDFPESCREGIRVISPRAFAEEIGCNLGSIAASSIPKNPNRS